MDPQQPVEPSERVAGRTAPHRPSDDGAMATRPVPPAAGRGPCDAQARRRWSSRQLLGDQHEIEIAHADSVYRLRVTSLGKLILTK